MKPAVRQLLFGSQFTPAKLFLGDAPGVWFDRQDLDTMYQDSAGTTPCAVGSPVGLALDKSKGLVLGAELRSTGAVALLGAATAATYDTTTGVATTTRVDAGNRSYVKFGVPNTTYKVSVTGGVGGTLVRDGSFAAVAAVANGVTQSVIVSSGAGFISFDGGAAGASTFTVNSVAALPGNHATQGTAPSRPDLLQDASGRYYAGWDGVDGSMTSATGGGATAGFFFCAAITVLGGAGTSRNLYDDRGVNTGYIVRVSSLNQLQFVAGNGAAFTFCASTATLPVGETHVVTAWDDGVNLKVQIDQGPISSVARPAVAAGTAGFTIGKINGSAGEFFNGRDYGMVYRGSAPTATEIARTQRFLAARAGVTL